MYAAFVGDSLTKILVLRSESRQISCLDAVCCFCKPLTYLFMSTMDADQKICDGTLDKQKVSTVGRLVEASCIISSPLATNADVVFCYFAPLPNRTLATVTSSAEFPIQNASPTQCSTHPRSKNQTTQTKKPVFSSVATKSAKNDPASELNTSRGVPTNCVSSPHLADATEKNFHLSSERSAVTSCHMKTSAANALASSQDTQGTLLYLCFY